MEVCRRRLEVRRCVPRTKHDTRGRLGAVTALPSRARQQQPATREVAATSSTALPRSLELATLTSTLFLGMEACASANEAVAYNSDGGEFMKNLAGVGYVILVIVFVFRVLRRRAARAREQKVSSSAEDAENSVFAKLRRSLAPQKPEQERETTAADAFLGAGQAALISAGLFIFSTKLTALISTQGLPEAYTARNISLTVRTILQGILWLTTFTFCVNSVGLTGLAIQLLLFPDSIKNAQEERARIAAGRPQLPKVSLTSRPAELSRAFDEAERLGKARAAAAIAESEQES